MYQEYIISTSFISFILFQIGISFYKSNFVLIYFQPKRKKDGNLLILTRTRTDHTGRRHSVAVPIINTKGKTL